jgi:hypothetical protein
LVRSSCDFSDDDRSERLMSKNFGLQAAQGYEKEGDRLLRTVNKIKVF